MRPPTAAVAFGPRATRVLQHRGSIWGCATASFAYSAYSLSIRYSRTSVRLATAEKSMTTPGRANQHRRVRCFRVLPRNREQTQGSAARLARAVFRGNGGDGRNVQQEGEFGLHEPSPNRAEILSATSSPTRSSCANQTTAIPPVPSSRISRKPAEDTTACAVVAKRPHQGRILWRCRRAQDSNSSRDNCRNRSTFPRKPLRPHPQPPHDHPQRQRPTEERSRPPASHLPPARHHYGVRGRPDGDTEAQADSRPRQGTGRGHAAGRPDSATAGGCEPLVELRSSRRSSALRRAHGFVPTRPAPAPPVSRTA